MKRAGAILLLLFPLFLHAQDGTENDSIEADKEKGPGAWFGLRFTHTEFSGSPYMRSVDFRFRPFVSEHFFLNYHFGFGKAWGGSSFHASAHAGLATGANLVSSTADDTSSFGKAMRLLGALAILVPEGVGYYKALSPRVSVAPYLNLLSYDYRKNEDREIEAFYLSAEAGAEGQLHLSKKVNIELRLGIKPIYRTPEEEDMPSRLGGEFSVGLNYRPRD